jgi:DNA-binding PadR family transcriptional regulator
MFRFLVLGLLRGGAHLHGYALVKEYRERSGAEVSTGNFYRELQRLVFEGLIRAADNPPDADARRTPYAITELGIEAFDEWFTSRDAADGAFSEDDLSARSLFVADADPAMVTVVLDRLEENLWYCGKTIERARQLALARAAAPTRFDVLSLLLARRLKRVAADLEFLEEVRAAYIHWLSATRRPAPPELAARGRRRSDLSVAVR